MKDASVESVVRTTGTKRAECGRHTFKLINQALINIIYGAAAGAGFGLISTSIVKTMDWFAQKSARERYVAGLLLNVTAEQLHNSRAAGAIAGMLGVALDGVGSVDEAWTRNLVRETLDRYPFLTVAWERFEVSEAVLVTEPTIPFQLSGVYATIRDVRAHLICDVEARCCVSARGIELAIETLRSVSGQCIFNAVLAALSLDLKHAAGIWPMVLIDIAAKSESESVLFEFPHSTNERYNRMWIGKAVRYYRKALRNWDRPDEPYTRAMERLGLGEYLAEGAKPGWLRRLLGNAR